MEIKKKGNKRSIWFFSQTTMPPQYESRLRVIKFANYLVKEGYSVKIFSSSIMHNMDIDLIEDNSLYIERTYGNLDFVHIKTKKYRNNGISRVLGMFQFMRRFIKISKNFTLPDIIIGGGVPFGKPIHKFAKKHNIKQVVQVQDLWPRAIVKMGVIKKNNPILPFLYNIENGYIKRLMFLFFLWKEEYNILKRKSGILKMEDQ